MSSVLYFSNYCDNCKKLLHFLSRSPQAKEMHFVCIDKREKQSNGATHVILPNGSQILLPPNITRVPALLLLDKSNHVLFGSDIMNYLQPQEVELDNKATEGNGEPSSYMFSAGGGSLGVNSDRFSFLDQDPESMLAKGDGGLRQMYNYATPDMVTSISTPPDNYTPDKVAPTQLEKFQQNRETMDNDTRQMFRPQ
jgi:hypothetical protein